MPWAMKRRILYLTGVILFFVIVVGGPVAYHILNIPTTCHDGIQNQGETSIDRGGPCFLLDQSSLQPAGIVWARTFKVRGGLFDAVAYIDNPNKDAGVLQAPYQLKLYDTNNILVAELKGNAFIMPGGPTPIFIGGIDTGNRDAVHAILQFTDTLQWERVVGVAQKISIQNIQPANSATASSITADALNTSTLPINNITFVATVFDPAGNAIASSQTALPQLVAGASSQIFFTWPAPFSSSIGRIDVVPVVVPIADKTTQQ